ncbi:MAG: hypothetical protein WAT36_05990 [Chromatiaceae bacterium]
MPRLRHDPRRGETPGFQLTDQSGEMLERLQALEYESLMTCGEVSMPGAGVA